jgi:lipid A 3-O-deacylase PagL
MRGHRSVPVLGVQLLSLLITAALALPTPAARGQVRPGAPRSGERWLGAWVGASFSSPVGTRLGLTPDRRLFLVALRAQYLLAAAGPVALAATVDVFPLAVVTNNPKWYLVINPHTPTGPRSDRVESGRSAVIGTGISPIGLQVYTASTRGIRFYLGGSGGGLWFAREVPVPDARRFNYVFEVGAGAEIPIRTRYRVVAGYKFHHLSNARTAPQNPGLDGNVVYLGVLQRQ